MTSTERDLQRALQGAREGDPERFAALYRIVQPRLIRYVRIIAPSLGPGEAREVASAAWTRVISQLRRLRGSEREFLLRLARIARDEAGARSARPDRVGPLAVVATSRADTDIAIAYVAGLPADVAEMVALRTVLGLDAHDTADVVGRRPGAVRIALYAGLRRAAGRLSVPGDALASSLDPWELDRLLDAPPDEVRSRDGALAALLRALRAPAVEDELSGLPAGRHAYGRAFAAGPALILALAARRLRALAGRKLAVATMSAVMLGAPAAAAYSGAGVVTSAPASGAAAPVSAVGEPGPSAASWLPVTGAGSTHAAAALTPVTRTTSAPRPRSATVHALAWPSPSRGPAGAPSRGRAHPGAQPSGPAHRSPLPGPARSHGPGHGHGHGHHQRRHRHWPPWWRVHRPG